MGLSVSPFSGSKKTWVAPVFLESEAIEGILQMGKQISDINEKLERLKQSREKEGAFLLQKIRQIDDADQNFYGAGTIIDPQRKMVYQGECVEGKPHGYGDLRKDGGRTLVYRGWWKHGLRHGLGQIFSITNKLFYEGEFKNNFPNGFGKIIYPNGDCYKGGILNGLRHGKGKILSAQGAILQLGFWRNGHANGYGAKRQPDGTIFHGGFKDGVPNGFGRVISLKGLLIREGIWKNGEISLNPFG